MSPRQRSTSSANTNTARRFTRFTRIDPLLVARSNCRTEQPATCAACFFVHHIPSIPRGPDGSSRGEHARRESALISRASTVASTATAAILSSGIPMSLSRSINVPRLNSGLRRLGGSRFMRPCFRTPAFVAFCARLFRRWCPAMVGPVFSRPAQPDSPHSTALRGFLFSSRSWPETGPRRTLPGEMGGKDSLRPADFAHPFACPWGHAASPPALIAAIFATIRCW